MEVLEQVKQKQSINWQKNTIDLFSKWKFLKPNQCGLGEIQKLVKKIFTDYYNFKKTQKICPILLFNESDAIIGKRKSAGSSSVSDTENAIQNVLLEELENFDGILFATSNLVANLDFSIRASFFIQSEI